MNRTPPRPKHKTGFIILGLISAGGILFCAGLGYLRWLFQSGMSSEMFGQWFSDMCGNDIYQEAPSPNGQYKVVVFERNCGATTRFSTQVSILDATQELPNVSGNIFAMDGHPDSTNVQVIWKSDQVIAVTHFGDYEVYYQQETFTDASQVFEIQYPNE